MAVMWLADGDPYNPINRKQTFSPLNINTAGQTIKPPVTNNFVLYISKYTKSMNLLLPWIGSQM